MEEISSKMALLNEDIVRVLDVLNIEGISSDETIEYIMPTDVL